jgi:hypothetical protein
MVITKSPKRKNKEKPIWLLPSFQAQKKKKTKNLTLDCERPSGHQVFFLLRQ